MNLKVAAAVGVIALGALGFLAWEPKQTELPPDMPARVSLASGRYPHQHGASRNGLRMRGGLPSLPKALQAHGYRTAAFISGTTGASQFGSKKKAKESRSRSLRLRTRWGVER